LQAQSILGSDTRKEEAQNYLYWGTCEAKYVAAAAGACQGVWLIMLVADLTGNEVQKFGLLVDNKSAIELSKNPMHHDMSKHIDTRFHYIRECIEKGVVSADHVGTED